MSKGSVWPVEVTETHDERTGATIRQMTDGPAISHSLYFSNPSWTPDGSALILTSHRSGRPNLFKLDEAAGRMVQLTDARGFDGFAACPSRDGGRVFYNVTDEVRSVDLETLEESVLARFPGGRVGMCSLSADGGRLVTGLARDGRSAVAAIDTGGSGHTVVCEPPRDVGHVMVCPADRDLILYTSDVNQRMWLAAVGRGELGPLHRHDKREWITHESFLGPTDQVIFARWPFALMAIGVRDDQARVVADFNAWHPSSNADGSLIVCDTTCPDIGLRLIDPATGRHRPLCYPRSSNGGSQWAFTVPADDDAVDESTYGPQESHPHPSFHPDGARVVYTSDRTGVSQVYVVEIPGGEAAVTRPAPARPAPGPRA